MATHSNNITPGRFNDMSQKARERAFYINSFYGNNLEELLDQWNFGTVCTVCSSIMPTAKEHINCAVCGSRDTVSPYYC